MNGFYEIIKKLPENATRDREAALIGIQSKAYKYIIRSEDMDLQLTIDTLNQYFDVYKNNYNNLSSYIFLKTPDETLKILKTVIRKDNKNIRRMKKNSSRIRREMMKMYKSNLFGSPKNETLKKSINIFCLAIREAFIIIRNSLSEEVYDNICLGEIITLNKISLKKDDIYIFNAETGKYYIDPGKNFSKSDLRKIQYAVAPYIFNSIHHKSL